jgi:hypothetical protein
MSSFVNLLYFENTSPEARMDLKSKSPDADSVLVVELIKLSTNLKAIMHLTFPFIPLMDGMTSNSTLELHVLAGLFEHHRN